MITQWVMNNLYEIAIFAMVTPITISAAFGLFLVSDDFCRDFKWYGKFMYGGAERDQDKADAFFGHAFITLGVVNIIVPLLVIYGYLYFTGKPLSALWRTT